ncbi:MAG: hypothetical protein IJG15_02530 [Lachnospiraceae bacterium]|nr:hypothetical protein [Lachnospiraceae bacterium]
MRKKFVAVMLAAVMAMAAFGCGSTSASSSSEKKQEETAETEQKTEDTKDTEAADAKAGAETPAEAASGEAASTDLTAAAEDDVEAVDISDLLGNKEELKKYADQKVAIKGAVSVDTEDPGGDLLRFLYDTDGNGDPGDDLYFSIEKDGETYLLKIESDQCDAESETYQTVENLEEDMIINLEGTLTGEDSPLMQVTEITIPEE